ncbi:MAG: type II secretion system protein, partial [Planctomycetes bacterium]|nr:type II secretion system protein [Planctomycetota bacterium]
MPVTPRTSTNRTVRSGGFTLIELLAVMLILGILMAPVPGASKLLFKDVYGEGTQSNMAVILTAIKAYPKAPGSSPSQSG